jgi:hypothetical protein
MYAIGALVFALFAKGTVLPWAKSDDVVEAGACSKTAVSQRQTPTEISNGVIVESKADGTGIGCVYSVNRVSRSRLPTCELSRFNTRKCLQKTVVNFVEQLRSVSEAITCKRSGKICDEGSNPPAV